MSNVLNLPYIRGGDHILENRLRQLREEKGWTQGELSEKSGVSRITINGIENGRVQVAKTDTLIKIADALGQTVTDIFFYTK